jgi:hypothetical protein
MSANFLPRLVVLVTMRSVRRSALEHPLLFEGQPCKQQRAVLAPVMDREANQACGDALGDLDVVVSPATFAAHSAPPLIEIRSPGGVAPAADRTLAVDLS